MLVGVCTSTLASMQNFYQYFTRHYERLNSSPYGINETARHSLTRTIALILVSGASGSPTFRRLSRSANRWANAS
jgi:hypothetical protein